MVVIIDRKDSSTWIAYTLFYSIFFNETVEAIDQQAVI